MEGFHYQSRPLTFTLKSDMAKEEKKRDEFRLKNRSKYVDSKWLKNISVMGKHEK